MKKGSQPLLPANPFSKLPTKASSARHGNNLRAPLPVDIGQQEQAQGLQKLCPHEETGRATSPRALLSKSIGTPPRPNSPRLRDGETTIKTKLHSSRTTDLLFFSN